MCLSFSQISICVCFLQPVVRPQPSPRLPPPPQVYSSDEDVDSPPLQLYVPRAHSHRQEVTSHPEIPSREASVKSDGSSSPSLLHSARLRVSDDDDHESVSKHSPRKHHPTPRATVRRIFYSVAEDDGEVLALKDMDWGSFLFKGHSLNDLIEQVQIETKIDDDIILCMRHPMSNKLYKMRLELPPNKAPMHVVVVRAESACMFSTSFSRPWIYLLSISTTFCFHFYFVFL